jgi:hypothetical protein
MISVPVLLCVRVEQVGSNQSLSTLYEWHLCTIKLSVPALAAWPRWAWSEAAAHATPGHHWRHLATLVPLYRSISVAVVGNGCRTAFWLDCWLGVVPIGVQWPVLLSHALDAEATVAAVL